MKEIYKEIKGYEKLYMVSNKGNIKSVDKLILINKSNGTSYNRFMKSKIIKDRKNNRGYHIITLYDKDGIKKDWLVHRLVAITFLNNDFNYTQVNHIDGNKSNNTLENLEWCDQSHNIKEAYRLGLRKFKPIVISEQGKINKSEKLKKRKYNTKKVLLFSDNDVFISEFPSAKDCALFINGVENTVRDCCNPKRKQQLYKGFKMKYK